MYLFGRVWFLSFSILPFVLVRESSQFLGDFFVLSSALSIAYLIVRLTHEIPRSVLSFLLLTLPSLGIGSGFVYLDSFSRFVPSEISPGTHLRISFPSEIRFRPVRYRFFSFSVTVTYRVRCLKNISS